MDKIQINSLNNSRLMSDLEYLLSMVDSDYYRYLDADGTAYDEICDNILDLMNSISKVNGNEIKYTVETNKLPISMIMNLLELVLSTPCLNIKQIDKLGFTRHLTELHNTLASGRPFNKEILDRIRRFRHIDGVVSTDPNVKEFKLYFIATVYKHIIEGSNLCSLNMEGTLESEILIYNKTLSDVLEYFYLDIPVCNYTTRKRNNIKSDSVIDEIWRLVYEELFNPSVENNHKKFYEFGAFDLWTEYTGNLYDFYETLIRMAEDTFDLLVLKLGPLITCLIALEVRYRMLFQYRTFMDRYSLIRDIEKIGW